MKHRQLLLILSIAVLTVAAAWREGNPERGHELYRQHCLRCHGIHLDGQGPDAPSLTVPPVNFQTYVSRLKDDTELEYTIKRGRDGTAMHGWENRFTDAQVHDLIAYIRSQTSQAK
jgi:mono/diheme cytochrome c family protein